MNQLFTDIDYLVDQGCDADDCIEFLTAIDKLGVSAEYFFEEFVFITEDPDDIPRLHDDDYLKINWGLN